MREPKFINAEQFVDKYGDWYTEEGTEIGFIGTIKDLVEQMPAADTPRWIPVTERLPKHEKARYWICTDTGYQCECRWTDNRFGMGNLSGEWGWSIFDTPQYSKVIAWMPLPSPYKEGEQNG